MNIKPVDRTIKQLLDSGFYRIPRFQRPYSWDNENVDDFWSDAIATTDPDYFIGSFVFYRSREHGDTYMVVDGQQRLTTLTLLLAAVRNALDALDRESLAIGIQKLIERPDINNDLRFVLQTETSYPYLQEHIQKHGAGDLPASAGKEEEALEAAYRHLASKVQSAVDAVDVDSTIAPRNKPKAKETQLLKIRDNALRLQLIVVELTTEDDAYSIFETLNTRGKDLGISDMVKNHLTRMLKPKNKGVDVAKDKWNSILTLFDESAANIDANAFIYHSWLSRYQYLGREKLFRVLRKQVTNSNAADFLNALIDDATLYRTIFEPRFRKWSKQELDILASLMALNIFRVVQAVPMALAILRDYLAGRLSQRQTRTIFRQMENFHVLFTAVTAQRTGGGTARMYAASAESLSTAKTPDARAQVLAEFRRKLRDRKPSYAEFEAGFAQLEFLSTSTKQKALVAYLLQRVDAHERSTPIAYEKMTIEHIASEHPKTGGPIPNCGQLGNLVLLSEPTNTKVTNSDLKVKRAAYRDEQVPLGTILRRARRWTEAEVAARTSELAKLAYDDVFTV
jgi:uncharacterized protein with ParB-like and HNH nuclease domain